MVPRDLDRPEDLEEKKTSPVSEVVEDEDDDDEFLQGVKPRGKIQVPVDSKRKGRTGEGHSED